MKRDAYEIIVVIFLTLMIVILGSIALFVWDIKTERPNKTVNLYLTPDTYGEAQTQKAETR